MCDIFYDRENLDQIEISDEQAFVYNKSISNMILSPLHNRISYQFIMRVS